MMTRSTNTQGTAARLSAFTGMALIFGALALMSHHNGVAEEQNKDRTGAPGSQQPCSACHNSGSYDVTPSISVYPFEGADTPVTTFVPFTEYYVVFEVDASGAPAGYGFQATAVFGNGDNAGTFISCTDNAQLEDVNGRHIVEQNDLSPSNTFGLFWGAPAGGEGPVTFYASMLASNGAYGNAGDSYAGTFITLDEAVTDIECPDCLDSDESLKAWATDEFLHIENREAVTLDVYALDGRWVRSEQVPAGKHQRALSDWGSRGLHIVHITRSALDQSASRLASPRTLRVWAD
jgi:hypothetical protein